jgi:hypothetical protein
VDSDTKAAALRGTVDETRMEFLSASTRNFQSMLGRCVISLMFDYRDSRPFVLCLLDAPATHDQGTPTPGHHALVTNESYPIDFGATLAPSLCPGAVAQSTSSVALFHLDYCRFRRFEM